MDGKMPEPRKPERKKPETRTQNHNPQKRRIFGRIAIFATVIVLLALAGTHLFALITGNQVLYAPENAVTGVMTPLQTGFSSVVNAVVGYLRTLKLRANIESAYYEIEQENEQLVYQAMYVDELEHKLSVYENLYDEISVNESMNPLVATVIAWDDHNYFAVFTINKGSNDGLKDFMAVTQDGALIGYTYDVDNTTAKVRSIIDSDASIAALISSTRDQGTIRGTLGVDGTAMCRMYYLPEDTLPRPGDTVVTSGVGMSFPKGIPIGTVRESTRGMESNKSYVVVEPLADFEHVEYVIVLRYQPDAEAIQSQNADGLELVSLQTDRPIPTIQIGSDFFQLAPTPAPTDEPTYDVIQDDGTVIQVTATPAANTGSISYNVPDSGEEEDTSQNSYTLPPTATPSPTPKPLDLSVEADDI